MSSQHWSAPYIGRRYVEGIFDCADLARLVQKEVFKREIKLPADRGYSYAEGTLEKFRAMAAQIDACKGDVASKTLFPKDGDAVLIKTRGYRQHIGIYCVIANEGWVLHAADAAGQVILQRIRDLSIRGLAVEGYYTWI